MESLKAGDNGDGTIGVNSTHQFFFDRSPNNRFYLYSSSNPATYFSSIESPGMALETVSLTDADYITIDGLDVQGGMYSSIGLSGSDDVIITQCNIGKNSNRKAINGDSGMGVDKTSDYVIISNNSIDSGWDYDYKFYTGRTPCGVYAGNGASYWYIHDNYIKDWWLNIQISGNSSTGYSRNHKINNNVITSPNFSSSKGIQIHNWGDGFAEGQEIYNNYIHDLRSNGVNIASKNNKISFNIFENITVATNSHVGGQSNSGVGIQFGGEGNPDVSGNYVFNNTFYNLNMEGTIFYNPFVYNNLYLNCAMSRSSGISVSQNNYSNYKNNLFYKTGSTRSTKFIDKSGYPAATFTVDEFEALGGTISGNIYPNGKTLPQIINTNYTLPAGSPGLDAGFNIEALVPDGFTDRFGNVVNRKNPNIGAIDNSTEEPTGFQIYLQGAFADGIMKTTLKEWGVIPKAQPYNISPWNYFGSESVQIISSEIVDWVLVELRSDVASSSIAAKRAAFLTNDGSIVDLDGKSKLSFDGVSNGNYYVVISHRNHISVMSAVKIPLSESSLNYNFTTSRTSTYGNDLADLGNGKYGMYAGDGDGDGTVNVLDYGMVGNYLFQTGYQPGDHDLNGKINVLDYGRTNQNLLKVSNVP
jgi:hypothetical protein